jgi:hypothetical protein
VARAADDLRECRGRCPLPACRRATGSRRRGDPRWTTGAGRVNLLHRSSESWRHPRRDPMVGPGRLDCVAAAIPGRRAKSAITSRVLRLGKQEPALPLVSCSQGTRSSNAARQSCFSTEAGAAQARLGRRLRPGSGPLRVPDAGFTRSLECGRSRPRTSGSARSRGRPRYLGARCFGSWACGAA